MDKTNRQRIRRHCKSFTNSLSSERKIRIKFCRTRGKIIDFSIQYLLLHQGEWRQIIRIDTGHRIAHKHIFYYKRKRHNRQEYLGEVEQYNEIYTEWYNKIAKNYKKLENYYFN